MIFLDTLKRWALGLIWGNVLLMLFIDSAWIARQTELLLAGLVIAALFAARKETLLIVGFIFLLTLLLLSQGSSSIAGIWQGLERALLFAALLPTLQLTRATVRRMAVVQLSQQRFKSLPEQWRGVGFLFGSHAFGAILNTGAFAIMSAVVADNATQQQRLAAARASLRGMNIAIFWSPFFVGFAVASTYLPAVPAWQIMPLGFALVLVCFFIAALLFVRPLSVKVINAALYCLKPIVFSMGLAAGLVVVFSLLSPFSTLQSVLLLMPLLCFLVLCMRPTNLRGVVQETYNNMARMGEDLSLISAAMILGTVAEHSPLITEQMTLWMTQLLPSEFVVASVVLLMFTLGIIGLHPMITGTVLLVMFAGSSGVADLPLMMAMLVGWALSSMTSISSLSVITSGVMYQVPPLKLAFSINLLFAAIVAFVIALLLSLLNSLLTG